jgi:cytosine/adenosine deaminase-related metal-dependent hydrolase
MPPARPLLAAALALPLLAAAEPAPITIINGATIVNPSRTGETVAEPHATIVIAGERIQFAGAGITFELPQDAKVIDARGKWVIPGLVDAHVHFFQSGNLYTRPDAADFNAVVPYAEEVARNKARLDATFKVWLANGVTGVVDVGGPFWNFEVRDHSLLAPAARQLEREADFIKVWFIHRSGDDLAAQESIVKAAGDSAHAAGKRLAVHTTELEVARADPLILAAMHDLDRIPKDRLPLRVAELMANPRPLGSSTTAMKDLRRIVDVGVDVVMGTGDRERREGARARGPGR